MSWKNCGDLIRGGAYLYKLPEKQEEYGGTDVDWIVDPPTPLPNWQELGINPQGQSFLDVRYDAITMKPVKYAFDWIGECFYPSPVDWLEEIFQPGKGITNRLGVDFDNPKSTIKKLHDLFECQYLCYIHNIAVIDPEFRSTYFDERILMWGKPCIKDIPEHIDIDSSNLPMCASLWWEDLPRGRWNKITNIGKRIVTRKGDNGVSFKGAVRPKDLKTTHTPGIFYMVPMSLFGLLVVMDPQDHVDDQVMDILQNAGLDVPIQRIEG